MTATDSDDVQLFVPGRLCLFGEHSDWAAQAGLHQGYCLVVGTDQGLQGSATASESFDISTALPPGPGRRPSEWRTLTCPWSDRALRRAAEDQEEFFRYCAGVALMMMARGGVGGLDLSINRMDLPLKKGVSSSAAVCVLVASAFDRVYDLGLFPHEIMELAYQGERMTGSQCGRMDQACIFGKTPVLLTFDASDDIRVEPVSCQGEISMLFIDLAGQKDTIAILSDLRAAHATSEAIQTALGADNERIVRRAYRALSEGDPEQLGVWMTEAQRIFDCKVAPACPEQLRSPRLHEVLTLAEIQPHIYGGKGVGSQGDGTAQLVARSKEDRRIVIEMIGRRMPEMRCFPLSISPAATGR